MVLTLSHPVESVDVQNRSREGVGPVRRSCVSGILRRILFVSLKGWVNSREKGSHTIFQFTVKHFP